MRILELHAPHFAARWRREHDVVTWGPHAHCDLQPTGVVEELTSILARLPAGWSPDVILFGDDSNPLLVLGLEDAPCPLALLSIDAHHHAGWHAPLAAAMDLALVAQRDYLPAFAAAGAPHARWLPLWAPDALPLPAPEKTIAVSFVGSLDAMLHPERVALLDALRRRLPLYVAEGPYAEVFGRSRIVFNQTVRGDLNGRVFEAMACGGMLLTERTGNGLGDLFTDGEELVTYPRGDVEAIVAAAERWLGTDAGRAAIAERGRARVLAAHCESHRAAEVVAGLGAIGDGARRPRHAALARTYSMLAYYARRLDEVLPGNPRYPALRAAYLAAAERVARSVECADADRSAVLGSLAMERGDLADAIEHLDRAVALGARCEDHLLRNETLVRAGAVGRARAAAGDLAAAHPDYELGPLWQATLAGVTPEAHP